MRVAILLAIGLLVLAAGAYAEKAPVEYPEYSGVTHERQGGDTIANATPITVVPSYHSGTTVGFNDDYDEVCYYTGSTSPDVVYSFVACETGNLQITLCVAPTNYDTKLYVYDANLNVIRCNDDWCSSPFTWDSELSDANQGADPLYGPVPVTEGELYYIVVDGYYGASGDYGMDVWGLDCTTPTEGATFSNVKGLYR